MSTKAKRKYTRRIDPSALLAQHEMSKEMQCISWVAGFLEGCNVPRHLCGGLAQRLVNEIEKRLVRV